MPACPYGQHIEDEGVHLNIEANFSLEPIGVHRHLEMSESVDPEVRCAQRAGTRWSRVKKGHFSWCAGSFGQNYKGQFRGEGPSSVQRIPLCGTGCSAHPAKNAGRVAKMDLTAGFGLFWGVSCRGMRKRLDGRSNSKGQSKLIMGLFYKKRALLGQKKAFFETKRGCSSGEGEARRQAHIL